MSEFWNDLRAKYFPAVRDKVYLNVAGGGPMPTPVRDAGKQYYDENCSEGDCFWEEWLKRMQKSRESLSRLLNCESSAGHNICFTTNTSHGMNIIALTLEKEFGTPSEQTILCTKDEFPSSTIPFINRGFKLVFVEPLKESGLYTAECFKKAFDAVLTTKKNKPIGIICSHVEYCTGLRNDPQEISDLCKQLGIVFVLNVTQSLGAMQINVKKWKPDFVVGNGFKFGFGF